MLTKRESENDREASINHRIKQTAHSSVPKSLTTKPDRTNSVPTRRKSINLKLNANAKRLYTNIQNTKINVRQFSVYLNIDYDKIACKKIITKKQNIKN